MPIYPPTDEPLNRELLTWQQGPEDDGIFSQQIQLEKPWQTALELRAEYRFTRDGAALAICGGFDGVLVPLDQPVALQPVTIDKPWGREVWFTGMESRGESTVVAERGTVPLSNYLALAPDRLCGKRPIVLLKILDPKPEPVSGDLYFEVHHEKREVYVVTAIDTGAWPQGSGEIRLGMNQQRRAEFADDAAFRAAYLAAVTDYEIVRRAIDSGTAVDPALEAGKRRAMEAFTSVRSLAVGEVVSVPPWMPHSLQHGVRVVEFQTPSYERLIVSFAQRVHTQDHWDSKRAIANMSLDPPAQPKSAEVAPGIAVIAEFDDFSVWRIELAPGAGCQPPLSLPYAVCMNISGGVTIAGQSLAPEQACFVPSAALPVTLRNISEQTSVSLIAAATW